MAAYITNLRRVIAALVVCAGVATAQNRKATPPLVGARVAGEAAVSAVGYTLGSEGALFAAAGVAYLVTGHGGDIDNPALERAITPLLWIGGGVGAASGAWYVSRYHRQASHLGRNVAIATVVNALAYQYAGWPMTKRTRERTRSYSAWRRMSPVIVTALTATAVASATRRWNPDGVVFYTPPGR